MFGCYPIRIQFENFPGGYSGGGTPLPIPNREVKPSSADGTAWETLWESRSLPGIILKARILYEFGLFCFFDQSKRVLDKHGLFRNYTRSNFLAYILFVTWILLKSKYLY